MMPAPLDTRLLRFRIGVLRRRAFELSQREIRDHDAEAGRLFHELCWAIRVMRGDGEDQALTARLVMNLDVNVAEDYL